ncbi:unnamed protein product, partial [Vitis vinifera]
MLYDLFCCCKEKQEDIHNRRIIPRVSAVAEVMVRAVDWIHCLFYLPSNTFEECHADIFQSPFRLKCWLFWTQKLPTHYVFSFHCLTILS